MIKIFKLDEILFSHIFTKSSKHGNEMIGTVVML